MNVLFQAAYYLLDVVLLRAEQFGKRNVPLLFAVG
jgi:hypothetical protein